MKKQIILTLMILLLMNGCVLKRVLSSGKGHGGGHSPMVRPR
jgi:uncharacterized protein YceK